MPAGFIWFRPPHWTLKCNKLMTQGTRDKLRTSLVRLLKGLVIALGGFSLLAYLVAATVSHYPQRIAASLSTLLGIPVQVEHAQVDWHPLFPGLRLQGVAIGSGVDQAEVRTAVVGLDFTRIFKYPASNLAHATLMGVKLHVIREPGNNLHVLGLPLSGDRDAAGTRSALPVQLRLADAEVIWEDRQNKRPPLRIAPVSFEIDETHEHLRLAAFAHSPRGELMLAAELAGDLSGLAWSGRSRMIANRFDVAALLGDYLPEQYRLSNLVLNGDLVITWDGAAPVGVQGRVDMANVRLIGDAAMQFGHLGADIAFLRESDAWRLELTEVLVTRAGRTWPASTLTLQLKNAAPGLTEIRAAADFLRLEDLAAILQVRSPWAELDALLTRYALRGDVHNGQIELIRGADRSEWRAAASFSEVSTAAAGKIPGLTKLSGSLRARSGHVQIELDSRSLAVDFGDLFRSPLGFDRAAGRLDWLQVSEAAWELSSDDLRLSNAELTTRTRLRISAAQNEPLFVDLRSDFSSPDVSIAGRYYPTRIMRPALVQWLDRGIVSGSIPRGGLVIHGPIADFPFADTHNGHFEVLFDVDDLQLDFRNEWPPLTDMSAEIRFHALSLDIAASEARIYDSRVEGAHGRFERLYPATPLVIQGKVAGPLGDELRLLRESPLRTRFSAFTQAVRPSGQARLTLDLAIPMHPTDSYTVNGALQFLGAGLDLKGWDLPLTDIRGRLSFDRNSLRGQGIRARGLDTDLDIAVEPTRHGTRIAAHGRLEVPVISALVPQLPLHDARGASRFDIGVTIPNPGQAADIPVWLDVHSDLRGIEIAAPPPLGKDRAAARTLDVRIPLSGRRHDLRLSYAGLLSAVVAQDFSRGGIQLGPDQAELPDRPVFSVRGQIAELELEKWSEYSKQMASKGGAATLPELDAVVAIGQVRFGELRIPEVELKISHSGKELRGAVSSAPIQGRFTAPYPGFDPLTLDLDYLKVQFDDDHVQSAQSAEPHRADPRDWPSFRVSCKTLVVNDADLGALTLRTTPENNGLTISQLALSGAALNADTTGAWRHSSAGVTTRLTGTLATPNLGQLLQQLGFARQLDDNGAKAEFDLQWPGDPGEITRREFTGHLDLELDRGRFLDIDPGVGRVVGLLNFNALQRRLRLDFSDLFKKGLSFDRITGTFTLDQGQAYTNDLAIEGPSGTIKLAGRTGLTTRDVDHLVTVTPKLDATLPVAGAIAGGPVAGIAVLVAQQLMSEKVDELNRFQYSVRGPWADATVKLENSGSIAKLFRSHDQDPDQTSPTNSGAAASATDDAVGDVRDAEDPDLKQLPPTDGEKPDNEIQNSTNPIQRIFENLGSEGTGLEVLEDVAQ